MSITVFLPCTTSSCDSGKPVFVFSHYPADDACDENENNTDRLIDMLAEYNQEHDLFYFCGHTHMPLYLFWSFHNSDGFPEIYLPRNTELAGNGDNEIYEKTPALYEKDYDPEGFKWIAINDMFNNVYGIRRNGRSSSAVAFFNFSDQPHIYVYTPKQDEKLKMLLHTDWDCFNGTVPRPKRRSTIKARGIGGVKIELPAFSAVLYEIAQEK